MVNRRRAMRKKAVPTFQRATVAMDNRDYSQSAQLYRQVPFFSPALRWLGFSIGALGQTDEAIVFLKKVVKMDRSPEDLISLAQMVAYPVSSKISNMFG
jgi:hypothetical protein